jgi:hypothetical protein
MARSAMPGWDVDCGISVLKRHLQIDETNEPAPLAIRACACFEQRAFRPLAIRDRRRLERRVPALQWKCGAWDFVPAPP